MNTKSHVQINSPVMDKSNGGAKTLNVSLKTDTGINIKHDKTDRSAKWQNRSHDVPAAGKNQYQG